MKHHPTLAPSRMAGASMIEVLVSVLLLSFGLLGVAGMQTAALRNNLSALQSSQATIVAYYMLDSMRVNREAALAGGYNAGDPEGDPSDSSNQLCAAPTGTSLAALDQSAWLSDMRAVLGGSERTCFAVNCTAAGICTVRVLWDDTRGTGGAQSKFITIQSSL